MAAGEMVAASVPMVRTLDLEFLESTAERAVVHMPARADFTITSVHRTPAPCSRRRSR